MRFITALVIILCMISCGDGDATDIYDFFRCGVNAAYTGYYIATLDITRTGDQCDPADIPPTPIRIEFGDVGVDADCDLFFDDLGLLNGQTVSSISGAIFGTTG